MAKPEIGSTGWGPVLNAHLDLLEGRIGTNESRVGAAEDRVTAVETEIDNLVIPGPELPAGGTTGQVLSKASDISGHVTWSTVSGGGGGPVTLSDLPAGSVVSVFYTGTAWPARPTGRTDITVQWIGGTEATPPTAGVANVDLWIRSAV